MVGVGRPVLIALSAFTLSKVNNVYAALLCGMVGFHFLCVNYDFHDTFLGIGSLPSLKVASVLIPVLLWINRSIFSIGLAEVLQSRKTPESTDA